MTTLEYVESRIAYFTEREERAPDEKLASDYASARLALEEVKAKLRSAPSGGGEGKR